MAELDALNSVVCLFEQRIQQLRNDSSSSSTLSPAFDLPLQIPPPIGIFEGRAAAVSLYEEAMRAAQFELRLMEHYGGMARPSASVQGHQLT